MLLQRVTVAILMLSGLGMLAYGLTSHRQVVFEEEEVKVRVLIPSPFGMPPMDGDEIDEEAPAPPEGDPGSDSAPESGLEDNAGDAAEDDSRAGEGSPFEANPFGQGDSPFATDEDNNGQSIFNSSSDEASPFGDSWESEEGSPFATGQTGADPWEDQSDGPWLAPPEPQYRTVSQVVLAKHEEPETVLVREVTYGGLRLVEGRLERTYTGKPPSRCPT